MEFFRFATVTFRVGEFEEGGGATGDATDAGGEGDGSSGWAVACTDVGLGGSAAEDRVRASSGHGV